MGQQFKKYFAIILGVACFSLGACASSDLTPVSEIELPSADVPKANYRIGAGDELELKFFFTSELNDRVIVRPDGKISIMFAQNVQAEGLSADELAADIRALYAKHVKQLDLVVIVRSFASHRAFVGGEVAKPGSIPLTGNETVLQVLSSAGWVTPEAGGNIVVVRRPDATSKEKAYEIDMDTLKYGQNLAQNIPIQAGDLILVPPSDVVSVDRWIDQNIRRLLPFTMSTGVSYNINGDKN